MRYVFKIAAVAALAVGTLVVPIAARAGTHGTGVSLSISGPVHVSRHHVSYETVTVHAGGCVTDVQAYATSTDGQDSTFSVTSHARGRTVKVRIPFTNLSEGGTWHLSSVFVATCGSHHAVQFSPAGARFMVRH